MNLSFKNRLAFYYMLATAIIIAVVFSIVYLIVQNTVYKNLDNVLTFEARKHTKEIKIKKKYSLLRQQSRMGRNRTPGSTYESRVYTNY